MTDPRQPNESKGLELDELKSLMVQHGMVGGLSISGKRQVAPRSSDEQRANHQAEQQDEKRQEWRHPWDQCSQYLMPIPLLNRSALLLNSFMTFRLRTTA